MSAEQNLELALPMTSDLEQAVPPCNRFRFSPYPMGGLTCISEDYDYCTDLGPSEQSGEGDTHEQAFAAWLENNEYEPDAMAFGDVEIIK